MRELPEGVELLLCLQEDTLRWSTRELSGSWISRAQEHLGRLLAAGRRGGLVKELVWSSEEEQRRLSLFRCTGTTAAEVPLLELLRSACERWPERVAVGGGAPLRYAELWRRSGVLARLLEGPVVAVLLERGGDQVVALLAAWRAGAACMPLDVATPLRRLQQMLREAQVAVTRRGFSVECRCVYVEDVAWEGAGAPMPALPDESRAYVLFTSGSTGVPKALLKEFERI